MDYQNLTKDRSLGTVELKVSELAREMMTGAGDSRFSFESTGKMDKSEPIRLDRGNQYKGQLHYLAEFLPAFALEGLNFETGSNELQAAVEGVEDGNDLPSSSSSKERETRAITTTEPIGTPQNSSKNHQPTNATPAAESTKGSKSASSREGSPPTQVGKTDGVKQKNEGIRMSKDELLTHRRWHLHTGTLFIKSRSQSPGSSSSTLSLANFPRRAAWRSSSMTVTGLPSAPPVPVVIVWRGNTSVKAS
jgi:hypothetical protein